MIHSRHGRFPVTVDIVRFNPTIITGMSGGVAFGEMVHPRMGVAGIIVGTAGDASLGGLVRASNINNRLGLQLY